MTSPRVSVVCIFLDEEDFLAEAVESVLAQDFDDFELLLIDDGSSDSSSQIAKAYAAENANLIRYLDHPGHANRGCSASRNLGVNNARADMIAFIDGDDVWRPAKLREQIAILDANPEIGMVCGAVNYWNSWCGGEDRTILAGGMADVASFPPQPSLKIYPLGSTEAPLPSDVLLRREIFERIGGCVDEFRGLYEDHVLFAKVFLAAPIWFSSSVWTDYRQHPASICSLAGGPDFRAARIRFLDWLADYLEKSAYPSAEAVTRALEQARWRMDHPWFSRQFERLRRLRQVSGL